MSDFFEERKDEAAEEEAFEEGSTIFSAPEEKNDKVAKPKLFKKILVGVFALGALVGVILGIALLVEKAADIEENPSVKEYYVLDGYTEVSETTEEKSLNYDAFSKVDLKSEKLELSFYLKAGEDEDSSSVWLESSIPEEYTSETTVASVAKALLGMKYTRVISEEIKEGVDYGFDKPIYSALVTDRSGKSFEITVGKQAADQSGYYVTSTTDNKVYLVRGSYIDGMEVSDKMSLTKALSVSAFAESDGSAEYYTSGALTGFDYLYFSNKKLGKTYKFETVDQTEGQSYNTYTITEPINRMTNDTGIAPIIEIFSSGIDSKGLYSITKTDAEIKAFGLDSPDMTAEIKAGKQERKIAVKLQADGDYALISSDMDVILRVAASSLSTVGLEEKDIFSVFLFIETLADIDEFKLSGDSVNLSFGIVTEETEENGKKITGVEINGAEATAPEEFQSYYQFVLGVKTLGYEASDLSGKKAEATLTMTKQDGSAATVVEYYQVENGRYQVVVNGEQSGVIGSSSFRNILKYAQNVADGKVYNS